MRATNASATLKILSPPRHYFEMPLARFLALPAYIYDEPLFARRQNTAADMNFGRHQSLAPRAISRFR